MKIVDIKSETLATEFINELEKITEEYGGDEARLRLLRSDSNLILEVFENCDDVNKWACHKKKHTYFNLKK